MRMSQDGWTGESNHAWSSICYQTILSFLVNGQVELPVSRSIIYSIQVGLIFIVNFDLFGFLFHIRDVETLWNKSIVFQSLIIGEH